MKISVCMATYNGGKHIKEQLDSILCQDLSAYPDAEMEIIISDDGSTDETVSIIKQYADKRIKVIQHTPERNHRYYRNLYAATANFIHALSETTGEYIFFSDQDDIWYKDKISETLNVLTKKEGVCATAFDIIDDEGRNTGEVVYQHESFWKLKKNHSVYGFSLGMTRSELKYLLPFPGSIPQHDTFIHHLAQRCNRLYFIDKKCAAHRWTETNNTSNSANNVPAHVKLFTKFRMYAIVLWRCYTR